jgi:SAM-dependent methyltransferase
LTGDAYINFPSAVLRSFDDFKRLRSSDSDLLDERYRREQSLGSKNEVIVLRGTCGPCLRVTEFTSATEGGEITSDGRHVPSWREQQMCNCPHALTSRERAILHVALPLTAAADWYKLGMVGSSPRLANYFLKQQPDITIWSRFELTGHSDGLSLGAEAATFHMIVSPDYLNFVPPLDEALREVARLLTPGGIFAFTIPFYFNSAATVSQYDRLPVRDGRLPIFSSEPVHQIGWDILGRLRHAGFEDSKAYCYWSEELGYLGTFNMIFVAYR